MVKDISLRLRAGEEDYRQAGFWGDASLLDWFRLAVKSVPDRLAVIDRRDTALTFAQLDERASRLAAWMVAHGVTPGAVVGVQIPNWAEFTEIYAACLKVGAVINPLPTNLRLRDMEYICQKARTVLTFHPTKFSRTEYEPIAQELAERVPSVKRSVLVPALGVAAESLPSLDQIRAETEPLDPASEHQAHGNDMAALLFTSGSEAAPKGVMLSHNNLIASERAFAYMLNITAADSMFMPAPVGHATGFMHGVTMPILAKITSVLCDSVKGPDMLEIMRKTHVTGGMAVPAIADIILTECEKTGQDVPDMRFMCCGGSPVSRLLIERARGYGFRLYSVYGSTESAPHTMTTFTDSEEKVSSTDGRACIGTQIKIVDPDTREELPPGEVGEEASRGPAVFMGYLDQPELTAKVKDEDGWYYSGDLAVMDDGGYIRIVGRLKDIIIRGGENISCAEIEGILREHPNIAEVALIGIDDDYVGQRCCACLVTRDGSEITVMQLREYFIANGIAKFKIPEYVVMLPEMPLTHSGKVSKGKLRERYCAELAAKGPDCSLPQVKSLPRSDC